MTRKQSHDEASTTEMLNGLFTQVHAFGKDSFSEQKIDYHNLAITAKETRPLRESIVHFVATAFCTK